MPNQYKVIIDIKNSPHPTVIPFSSLDKASEFYQAVIADPKDAVAVRVTDRFGFTRYYWEAPKNLDPEFPF